MKRINKDETPLFWSNYYLHNKGIRYDNADEKIKLNLRQHMLGVQKNICAYCCAQINDISKAHNEHIKPKDLFPKLSMEYDNLVVSWTTQGKDATCGMHKGNDYDEKLFVSPLSEDCESHFRFEQNGKVTGISKAGEYTIELLNLNEYRLVTGRRTLIEQMMQCKDIGKEYIQQFYIDEIDGKLPRFVDVAEYFMRMGYFD